MSFPSNIFPWFHLHRLHRVTSLASSKSCFICRPPKGFKANRNNQQRGLSPSPSFPCSRKEHWLSWRLPKWLEKNVRWSRAWHKTSLYFQPQQEPWWVLGSGNVLSKVRGVPTLSLVSSDRGYGASSGHSTGGSSFASLFSLTDLRKLKERIHPKNPSRASGGESHVSHSPCISWLPVVPRKAVAEISK